MSTLALGATIIVSVLGSLGGIDLIRAYIAGRPRPGWTFIIPTSGVGEKIGNGPLRHVRHWTMRPLGAQEMYEVRAHVWGEGVDLRAREGHAPPTMYRPVMSTRDETIEMDIAVVDPAPADAWVGVTWVEHHGRYLLHHAQCRQVHLHGQESDAYAWKPYQRWWMTVRGLWSRLRRRGLPPSGRWKRIGMTRTASHGPESVAPRPRK